MTGILVVSCGTDKPPKFLKGPWVMVRGEENIGIIWDFEKGHVFEERLGTDWSATYDYSSTHLANSYFPIMTQQMWWLEPLSMQQQIAFCSWQPIQVN